MFKTITNTLDEWSRATSERGKLQHAYVALAVASVVLAGLVGLVNYDMGQRILAFALLSAGIFVANAIAWALLSGLVLVRLNGGVAAKPAVRPAKSTAKSKTKKS